MCRSRFHHHLFHSDAIVIAFDASPSCLSSNSFFFLRNVSKVYDVDQFEQVVSKMFLIMNLLLLSIDWLMVAKTAMFV